MLELMAKGGPIMWAILACSVAATIIFLERLLHLHRAQINPRVFLEGIYTNLERNNTVEAVTICEETPGPVACIVQAAIAHHDESPEDMRRAIEQAGVVEVPRLEWRVGLLATVAKITPLLGLTGTVLGMIRTLNLMSAKAPLVHSGDLTEGLWLALITTAAGLIVAIPCYAAYNFLVCRIESLLIDMETAGVEIYNFLSQRRPKTAPSVEVR